MLSKLTPKKVERTCDCPRAKQQEGECPLQGKCLTTNNVYQATVVETKVDGEQQTETYVGVSVPPWKQRFRNHISSFNNIHKKKETMLSSHIWDIKDRGSTFKVTWKILDKGTPHTPVTGNCMLCTKEKYYILRKPELGTLNQRQELGSHCRHISMSLLAQVEKVKIPPDD